MKKQELWLDTVKTAGLEWGRIQSHYEDNSVFCIQDDRNIQLTLFCSETLVRENMVRMPHLSHLIDASPPGERADATDVGRLTAAAHERPTASERQAELLQQAQTNQRRQEVEEKITSSNKN